jgi:glycosyltransferase involved in cell wall biosynthesis
MICAATSSTTGRARAHGCRIVHTALIGPGSNRGPLARKVRRLLQPVMRRMLGSTLYGHLGLTIYPTADAVIVLNAASRDYVCEVYGSPREKVHVIPNGIEAGFVPASVPPKNGRLLYVGSIQPNKNQVCVAEAARAAKVPVTFLGDIFPLDQEYGARFRALADGGIVQWAGQVNDRAEVARMMASASGLVLASHLEAFPLVLLEALACGTPVMVTNMPALRSIFGDAIRYAPPAADPDYAAALAAFHRDCLAGLRQKFPVLTWDDVAAQVAAVYRDVCAQKP